MSRATSGDEDHLADIAPILDEVMRLRSLIKPEARRDLWFDDTGCRELHQRIAPSAQAVDLTPHMAEIDAEYAFVRVHELERIELKP